jgi:hypothetical protein
MIGLKNIFIKKQKICKKIVKKLKIQKNKKNFKNKNYMQSGQYQS